MKISFFASVALKVLVVKVGVANLSNHSTTCTRQILWALVHLEILSMHPSAQLNSCQSWLAVKRNKVVRKMLLLLLDHLATSRNHLFLFGVYLLHCGPTRGRHHKGRRHLSQKRQANKMEMPSQINWWFTWTHLRSLSFILSRVECHESANRLAAQQFPPADKTDDEGVVWKWAGQKQKKRHKAPLPFDLFIASFSRNLI